MIGKLVGAILGLLLFRSPWGLLIGLVIGHFYDQSMAARNNRFMTAKPLMDLV